MRVERLWRLSPILDVISICLCYLWPKDRCDSLGGGTLDTTPQHLHCKSAHMNHHLSCSKPGACEWSYVTAQQRYVAQNNSILYCAHKSIPLHSTRSTLEFLLGLISSYFGALNELVFLPAELCLLGLFILFTQAVRVSGHFHLLFTLIQMSWNYSSWVQMVTVALMVFYCNYLQWLWQQLRHAVNNYPDFWRQTLFHSLCLCLYTLSVYVVYVCE